MEHKKKYLGKLSFLFGLLFCLLLGFSSTTCYADYVDFTDFELSEEFWQAYINFYNQRKSNWQNNKSLNFSASTLKSFYDNYCKQNVKNYFEQHNANDGNMMLCTVTNPSRLDLYFIICNNSIGNPDITTKFTANNVYYRISSIYSDTPRIEMASSLIYSTRGSNVSNLNTDYIFSSDNIINDTTIDCCLFGVNPKPLNIANIYTSLYGEYRNFFLNDGCFYPQNSINLDPEPSGDVTPSGDNGGGGTVTPSGDSGSNIDYTSTLGDINNNITTQGQNIVNQISGDTQKITNSIDNLNNTLTSGADMDSVNITSGDILENFSFMADPYSNFWWDFIDGVELALLGSVRQLPVNWLGYNGYFNLDGLINYPTPIKNILSAVSTVCVVWIMLKWWKVIMDKLTSGDIDEVLEIVEEQGRVNITNLF